MTLEELGPFDTVLDVGGNVGVFAEECRRLWPGAVITSFEPIAELAAANRQRAGGRWWVERVAIGAGESAATIRLCLNQHSASTMMEPGTVRAERFGLRDRFEERPVNVQPLDSFIGGSVGRLLVKVDVEGFELQVIEGGRSTFELAAVAVVECQNDPAVFLGAPSPAVVDAELRRCGLFFCGVLDSLKDPAGRTVQFDGVWGR